MRASSGSVWLCGAAIAAGVVTIQVLGREDHSLAPDTLLWSGRSRTADPNEGTALFDEVGSPAAAEMAGAGRLRGAGP